MRIAVVTVRSSLGEVQRAVLHVRGEVHRAEVADGDLVIRGVQRDLGAEVGAVHHADVALRAAQVAGILEGHPGMPGLEQHREHLAPQVHGPDLLEHLDLAARGLLFVFGVALRKGLADEVVQVAGLARREQRPLALLDHPLHEQVGDPVGRVHVVRAAAVVAGVLAQLDELLDVDVPGLEVGADRALAFPALIHGYGGVVRDLQERDDALALAVGALDVGAHAAYAGPVVAEAAGEFRQQRVVLDRAEDAVEVVGDGGQVAGRELRAQRAGVEQRRRRAHEVEGAQQLVELDRAGLAIDLVDRQAHRDAHEEGLRQFEAGAAGVDEVAVVQGLQAEIGELQVALGLQCLAEGVEVVAGQLGVDQFQLRGALDVGLEVLGVALAHLGLRGLLRQPGEEAQRLAAQVVHQQARGHLGVVRLLLDLHARGHHQRGADVLLGDAVEQVAAGLGEDAGPFHLLQPAAGLVDHRRHARLVQRHAGAVDTGDVQHIRRCGRRLLLRGLGGTLLGLLLPVQHVGPRHLVVAAAHQHQFDLVLDVLDVHRDAAGAGPAEQVVRDLPGQLLDDLVDAAAGRGATPFDGEEGLGDRHADLRAVEMRDLAVAADHLVPARRGRQDLGARSSVGGMPGFGGNRRGEGLGFAVHKDLALYRWLRRDTIGRVSGLS
jgi:hypothetical protein